MKKLLVAVAIIASSLLSTTPSLGQTAEAPVCRPSEVNGEEVRAQADAAGVTITVYKGKAFKALMAAIEEASGPRPEDLAEVNEIWIATFPGLAVVNLGWVRDDCLISVTAGVPTDTIEHLLAKAFRKA